MFTTIHIPKDSYNHQKSATLTTQELVDYYEVNMEKISGIGVIPHLFERHRLKYNLRYIAVYFITNFLGCLWVIKWESNKKE